jgi:hypothetical protein
MLQGSTIPSTPTPMAVTQTRRLTLVALVVAFAIVIFDLVDGSLYLGDIDDVLRALQVRELLRSGAWFDRTLPMISMPEAYVSPWSRLVDLPYVVLAKGLSPFFGEEAGLKAAFQIWPPVMLIAYCVLVVSIVNEMLPRGKVLETPALVATMLAMALSIWEFSPGRIDHHNVQLLAILCIFWGLIRWTRWSAVMSGVAVVVSTAVGLELLPLVALVLAAVGVSWILRRPGSAAFYAAFGLAVALATPLAGLLLIGAKGIVATECDAFSAPYITGLVGYGLVTAVTAALLVRSGPWTRIIVLVVAGSALIAALAVSFPLCLSGPYHMIDPLSRELWLERVWQEHSILLFFEQGYFPHLLALGVLVVVLVLALPVVVSAWRSGTTGTSIVFAVAVAALVLTCLQTRYIRFPTALIPLFIPVALAAVSGSQKLAMRLLAGTIAALAVLGWMLHLAVPVHLRNLDVVDFMAFGDCKDPDLSDLASLPAGRIIAPTSLGLYMADRLPSGMTIAGISFHRSSPGIKRILEAFLSTDPQTRQSALAPFDYLAVCRFALPTTLENTTLYAALTHGVSWPGMVRVTTDPEAKVQIYRIDHERLN